MTHHPAPRTAPTGGPARWKLTEPVRLYLAGPALALLAFVAAVALADVPLVVKVAGGAVFVTLLLGIAAARASVYSPAGAMQERVDAALRARLNR